MEAVEQNTKKSRKEVISAAPLLSLPFSQAVGFGDLVFVSGTVGRDLETGEISREIEEQTRQVLENLDDQLTMAGTSLDRVLKAMVFLTDMGLYEEMNKA
jgi:2-iminobutanoate/2-iminopropanoate deaminase